MWAVKAPPGFGNLILNTFKDMRRKYKIIEALPPSKLSNIESIVLKPIEDSNISGQVIYLLLIKQVDTINWKKELKNICCTEYEKYTKLKIFRISYIPSKRLVFSASCKKCTGDNDKIFKGEELIEILKILDLIDNRYE